MEIISTLSLAMTPVSIAVFTAFAKYTEPGKEMTEVLLGVKLKFLDNGVSILVLYLLSQELSSSIYAQAGLLAVMSVCGSAVEARINVSQSNFFARIADKDNPSSFLTTLEVI